jgi:hypothetical protein
MKTKTSLADKEIEKQVKVDPELVKQINNVAADDESVEAIFMLRPDDPKQIAAPPERTEELTKQILQRVEAQVGSGPNRVNIFRNLGTFTVSAKPAFLRELLTQPGLASAMANKQQGQAYIQPHDIAPVEPGSNRGWSTPEPAKRSPVRSGSARSAPGKKSGKAAQSGKSKGSGKSHK